MSLWLSTTSLMPPTIPQWLEDICQKLLDNDESYKTVELMHPRIDDVFARVFAKALKENHVITTLILSCYALVDDGAFAIGAVLGTNTSITRLQLRDLRNPREIITMFQALMLNSSIEELSLRHCEICPRGAEAIARFCQGHSKLQEVRITDCTLHRNSLEVLCHGLKSNNSLQRVHLVNDEVNDEGAIQICSLLNEGNIQELYLGENDIGDDGVGTIAKEMCSNHSLRKLDLRCNGISSNAALAIQGMLVSNQQLLELSLSNNRLGNSGVMCISRALQSPRCTLERLDLDSNEFDSFGARSIASMLKINRSLKGLKIAFNSINDEGAKAIASSLEYNKTLEWLSLRRNGIGNVGAAAFAEKLPFMHGLKELLLTKNHVDEIGVSALLDGLRSNMRLEYLSVDEMVSEPYSREIMQLRRLNKAGRRIFREENSVAPDLWPRVYGRICEEPDLLFHFVSQKPDALMYIDTALI